MSDSCNQRVRKKRPPKPLDSAILRDLALAYVARFSTTQAKLEAYLHRKIRERGWQDGEELPDVRAISSRYVELGYVDDAQYARSKANSLLNRGYGARRIDQALYAAGVEEDLRHDAAPDELARRAAVLAMAKKRRFGPYFAGNLEHDRREKQIAALLRSGHSFGDVRAVIDASSVAAAEQWAAETSDKGH